MFALEAEHVPDLNVAQKIGGDHDAVRSVCTQVLDLLMVGEEANGQRFIDEILQICGAVFVLSKKRDSLVGVVARAQAIEQRDQQVNEQGEWNER